MEESVSLAGQIRESFACRKPDIRTYSPLVLAYVGDAVYELVVRTLAVQAGNRSVGDLHRETVRRVKAPAQAAMLEAVRELLTQEEQEVCRRGRNAKPYSVPKGATPGEYHKATAFEALLGYLYLTERTERLLELVREGLVRTDLWRGREGDRECHFGN